MTMETQTAPAETPEVSNNNVTDPNQDGKMAADTQTPAPEADVTANGPGPDQKDGDKPLDKAGPTVEAQTQKNNVSETEGKDLQSTNQDADKSGSGSGSPNKDTSANKDGAGSTPGSPDKDKSGRQKVDRLLIELSHGTVLHKVKSSTKLLQRTFYLDLNKMALYYEGGKKKTKDTTVRVSKIREVREGEKDYSKKLRDLDKSLCFVVILGAHKILYMMATAKEIRDKWVRGLRYAVQMEQLAEQKSAADKWVREAFIMADKNGDGTLDFDEVMKLLKTLNTDIKKKYAREMFDAADTNKNVGHNRAVLDKEEFVAFYNKLTKRPELEEIFLKYSRGKGYMNIHDFVVFLREGQKMVETDEEFCRSMIDQFEPESTTNRDHFTLAGFRNFLISERQRIFNPDHNIVYQDMSRPMTHYFIDSSHNTYLAEDQLKGPSSVEMYISALKKGCRCVELDCWDGPDGDPVIYHGHTLTSKIAFKDVINAINDYAFEASPYPVTLSLENHCSIEQQNVMAEYITTILGDKVWSPETDLIAVPSPEELRNKIIIKGKRLPALSTVDEDVSDEDEAEEMPQRAAENGSGSGSEENEQAAREKSPSSSSGSGKMKLCPMLSSITGLKSVSFKTVEGRPQPEPSFRVTSVGENKAEKLMSSQASFFNQLSQHLIIRTYPAGSRTDSSNYNPVPMWNHGCQFVALNYQTGGEAMQLNHGKFKDNGGSGYVLKPNFLLSEDMFGIVTGTVARNTCKILKITLISGCQIPKPKDQSKGEIIDPFIKIDIYGVPGDVAEYKTKVIENNGFNPRWYETCTFKIRVPELALVRFTVKDEDRGRDDFIGYFSLPVLSIQEGFRHFPLYDKYGSQFSQSMIFTHVTLTNE